jgi:antitoxin YefM
MSLEVTYSYARKHLAEVLEQVEERHEVAVIHREGHKDVAVISADDLASLREAAQPTRSPRNAFRLLSAIRRARRGAGRADARARRVE